MRKDSLLTATDGKKYRTKIYNLDVIISVGYRVKSKRGTLFRQWANQILKDYLLKGYSINKNLQDVRIELGAQDKRISLIVNLIKQAKRSIILIDNYIDETTLTMLSKRDATVSATIYTRQLSNQQQLDITRHNQQYPPITVNICQRSHDRFLIIDDVVYLFGASLKDAGKKLFAYIKMQETPASELLSKIR